MSQRDRRSNRRFRLKLPITVRLPNGKGNTEIETESQDVSSRGVFFFLPSEIQADSPVEIVMTLPHEITMAGPVRVRCLGRIRRSESIKHKKVGVVAAIERFEFLRGDSNAA